MKTRLTLILVLLIYIGAASHTHAQQKKVIKTMMIAGQDGSHYWQGACEAMKQILENSGQLFIHAKFRYSLQLIYHSCPQLLICSHPCSMPVTVT